MPGRCCSSTRRRAHRGSPPHRAVRSWTRQVAPDAAAHGRSLSPRRARRAARRPHIPAAPPRTRAGRSPRHASRSGVAAGLSRVAPHAPGGPPRHAPPVALLGLWRARTIRVDHVPGLCPEILAVSRGAGPRSPRSLGYQGGLLPAVEPRRNETPPDDPGRTGRAPPRATCQRGRPPPLNGLTRSSRTPKTLPHRSRVLSTGLPTAVPYSVDIGSKRPRDSPATAVNDTRTQHVGGVVHSHPQDPCGYSHPRNADDDGGPQGRVCRDKS